MYWTPPPTRQRTTPSFGSRSVAAGAVALLHHFFALSSSSAETDFPSEDPLGGAAWAAAFYAPPRGETWRMISSPLSNSSRTKQPQHRLATIETIHARMRSSSS